MTKQIPADFGLIGPREYAGRAPIQAPDWGALVESTHYEFIRRGTYLGGTIFDPVRTTDATDISFCGSIPVRYIDDEWDVIAVLYGEHVDATITLQNIENAGTTVATLNPTQGAGNAWATATATIAKADLLSDGTATGSPTLIYGDIDINVDTANSGHVQQIAVYAIRDVSDKFTTVITSWSALPSSPSDGDQVLYEDSGGARVTVEYDGTASQWVMIDTGGAWVTIDDFNAGSLDTALWSETDTNGNGNVANGRYEYTVVSGQSDNTNLISNVGIKIHGDIRCDFSFGGVSDPTTGNVNFFVQQRDFDNDGDGDPRNVIKPRIDAAANSPEIQHVYVDQGASFVDTEIATNVSRTDTFTLHNNLTLPSAVTRGEVEAVNSSGTSVGSNTHDFTADYAGNISTLVLIFFNGTANTSGTMWTDNVQVRI